MAAKVLLPFGITSQIPIGLIIAMLLVISAPHFMYASVFFSEGCAKFFSKNHQLFMSLSKFLKYMLIIGMLIIGFGVYKKSFTGLSMIDLAGACLFLFGLHLNILVYNLLGQKGVYYGMELRAIKVDKWVTGYPFSFFPHPQYLGSIMNWWAFCCFTGFDEKGIPRWDVIALTAYATLLYLFTMAKESNLRVKLKL